jgi:hypothetical protein
MNTVLPFSLLLIMLSSLTACDQIYARFMSDSKTLADTWTDLKQNSASTANSDTQANAKVDNTDSTENISIKFESAGETSEKPVTLLSEKKPEQLNSHQQSLPRQNADVNMTVVDKKLSSAVNTQLHTKTDLSQSRVFPENSLQQDVGARQQKKQKITTANVRTSQMPAEANSDEDSNDIFQRANSNQVILRNGEISIDFSKDMPVINSKNGIDLNSR